MFKIITDRSVIGRWEGEAILMACYFELTADTKKLGSDFNLEVEAVLSNLRRKDKNILDEPRFQQTRAAFRAMPDMDPSRYRPASESLVRRCLSKDFFHINPLVDLNNLVSLQHLIPVGSYDVDRLVPGDWTCRIGNPGETYFTLSGQKKRAEGMLILADSEGMFGSPVADSARASITDGTSRLCVVAFLPFKTTSLEADQLFQSIQSAYLKYFHIKHAERIFYVSQ